MTQRTLTALFDSRDDAEEAREDLIECGVSQSDINIVSQSSSTTTTGASSQSEGGFWEGIKDFFIGDDDRSAYAEGVNRGGFLLTARVEESLTDRAYRILEDDSKAVNFDERQEQWKASGWTGSSEQRSFAGQEAEGEQRIPIVEEQLKVGKREVERGGARVRSYVVETPVQEQVQLREERVEIERRPVDQTLSATDADKLFEEREIELTERAEEAVVAKEAFVREELAIRKDVETRTEQISDTVRHTEVDVDDRRGLSESRSFVSEQGGDMELTEEERIRRSSQSSDQPIRP